jgi:hypothetical protein
MRRPVKPLSSDYEGSSPSLRMVTPDVPMAGRLIPNQEAAGSIPARRVVGGMRACRPVQVVDDVAEWRGAELQPPLTLVRFQPSSLWP